MKLTKEIENLILSWELKHKNTLSPKELLKRKEQISQATKEYILKEIIGEEEPQHPSGMDREKINTRNEHRETQRAKLEEDSE